MSVARAVVAVALSCAACSNEFVVLERVPGGDLDAETPNDADAEPVGDASTVDAAVPPRDARVQDASTPDTSSPSPNGVNAVSAFAQTCALVEGALYCWGADELGQVGVLGDRNQAKPVKLANEEFSEVCAGEGHSCALRADGTTLCWGANTHGELGVGDLAPRETPTPVDARRFVALRCGGNTTCALAPRGELWCWGDNLEGKLGQNDPATGQMGTLTHSATPIPVLTSLRFSQVSVGQGHVCALSEQGRLYCWGRNSLGQLGIASTAAQTRTPTPVVGETEFSAITAGQFHSCAIDTAGGAWCWGKAEDGQLGVATNEVFLRVPTRLEGEEFESIAGSWFHTCAVKKNGTLLCWGRGEEGQLGGGDSSARRMPIQVGRDRRWRSVATGKMHTCAFADDGLYCWGANESGQLGQSDNARRYIPIKVSF